MFIRCMYKRFCTYIDLLLIDVVCLQINKQTLHFYDEVEFRPDEAVADQAIRSLYHYH